MIRVDKIISATWIYTGEDLDEVLFDHSIVVNDQKIRDIQPTIKAHEMYEAEETFQLSDHILLPGLINAHTHSAMSLLKGYADDLQLETWLNNYIWPAESKFVNYDFVLDGSELAIAEMIKGGTTTFNDMYFFPEATAEAVKNLGIRANIGLVVMEFPSNYANDPQEYLNKGFEFKDNWRDNKLITTSIAPHAPYSVSNSTFELINTYAEQLNLTIHTHLHETRNEIEESIKQFSSTPIERLSELGLLGPKLMAAHCVHLSENDVYQLKSNRVSVLCNISSNMKLGSGFVDVYKLINNNINIAIGTDSSASNNRLDMFSEMRSIALNNKALTMKSEFLKPAEVLRMATINGAKALGIDDITGSILKNKYADIIAINLDSIDTQPCYDPLASLIYCADRTSVEYVWINGETKLKEKVLVNIDENEILQKVKSWKNKINQT
jgi:5-methylthioadenosine/S-adenosylhomocysteine deaminase